MISLGYQQRQGDHTLSIKHSQDGKITLILVYVDDMIIVSNDKIEKQTLRDKLSAQFEIKDLLEYMALNERGVNCLREVFENFFRFNKILCVNPEQ